MRPRQDPRVARHVDDRAAASASQVRDRVLRRQKRTFQVGVETRVPFFFADIGDWLHHANAGVVDEDIEPTACGDGLINQCFHIGFHADVTTQFRDAESGGFFRGGAYGIEIANEHLGTMFREQDGGGSSDAGRSTSNNGDSVSQVGKTGSLLSHREHLRDSNNVQSPTDRTAGVQDLTLLRVDEVLSRGETTRISRAKGREQSENEVTEGCPLLTSFPSVQSTCFITSSPG